MNERLGRYLRKGTLVGSLGGAVLLANPLVAQGLKDLDISNIPWNGSNTNGSPSLVIETDRLAQLAGYAALDTIAAGTVIFVLKKKKG